MSGDTITLETAEERELWRAVYVATVPFECDAEGSAAWARADAVVQAYRERLPSEATAKRNTGGAYGTHLVMPPGWEFDFAPSGHARATGPLGQGCLAEGGEKCCELAWRMWSMGQLDKGASQTPERPAPHKLSIADLAAADRESAARHETTDQAPNEKPPDRPGCAELSQRDREVIAEMLEDVGAQLYGESRCGPGTRDALFEVANALLMDVDGDWVEMATRITRARDSMHGAVAEARELAASDKIELVARKAPTDEPASQAPDHECSETDIEPYGDGSYARCQVCGDDTFPVVDPASGQATDRPGWTLHRLYSVARTREETSDERYGQALFNTLAEVRPDIASRLRGSDADPFYANGGDEKAHRAIAVIESMWDAPKTEPPGQAPDRPGWWWLGDRPTEVWHRRGDGGDCESDWDLLAEDEDGRVRCAVEIEDWGGPCTRGAKLTANQRCALEALAWLEARPPNDGSGVDLRIGQDGGLRTSCETSEEMATRFDRNAAARGAPSNEHDAEMESLRADLEGKARRMLQRDFGLGKGGHIVDDALVAGQRYKAAKKREDGLRAELADLRERVEALQNELRRMCAESLAESQDESHFRCARCREWASAADGMDVPGGLCSSCWCAVHELVDDEWIVSEQARAALQGDAQEGE